MLAVLAIAGAFLTNPSPKPTPSPSPSTGANQVIYCIETRSTGSRIVERPCLTRAQWLDRNYDPLAPQQ